MGITRQQAHDIVLRSHLATISDLDLLRELVWRNGKHKAPVEVTNDGNFQETIVGLNKDETATITFYEGEALDEISE